MATHDKGTQIDKVPASTAHAGLTLSTSIGACFNASLLYGFLRKRGYYVPSPGWARCRPG